MNESGGIVSDRQGVGMVQGPPWKRRQRTYGEHETADSGPCVGRTPLSARVRWNGRLGDAPEKTRPVAMPRLRWNHPFNQRSTGVYRTEPDKPQSNPCRMMRCQTLVAQLATSIERQLTRTLAQSENRTQSG